MYAERVQSMIIGGAILKMNFRSQVLMRLGNIFKYVLPYLVLYRFFAFVIMQKKAINNLGYCLLMKPKNYIKKNL